MNITERYLDNNVRALWCENGFELTQYGATIKLNSRAIEQLIEYEKDVILKYEKERPSP